MGGRFQQSEGPNQREVRYTGAPLQKIRDTRSHLLYNFYRLVRVPRKVLFGLGDSFGLEFRLATRRCSGLSGACDVLGLTTYGDAVSRVHRGFFGCGRFLARPGPL